MRLKRVKLFGFKTFADRTEFNLEGGVVAVIGPNGCGKSNLVDAILWGLGEGNARQLRAQSGGDVIFSGSTRRKGVGFAEVSLLFDNEDGLLPLDSPEVSITRRLTRSGESEYAINKRSCRQRDVYELLADSGLGRAGYAIVGQKEIDQAVSASAEERRGWIDEAAGVQRYRSRKQESLKRLASAQGHLQRVTDILDELEGQREPLRREAEAARRYRATLTSLREIETGLLIDEIVSSVKEIAELEARIGDSLRVSGQETARAEALEQESSSIGDSVSDIEREMDTVRSLQQGSLTAQERAEAQIRLAEQRLSSLDELERSLGAEIESGALLLAQAESEAEAAAFELERERLAKVSLEEELAGVGSEARRLTVALNEVDRRLADAKAAQTRRLRQEAEAKHRAERRALAVREREGITRALPQLESDVEEARVEHEDLTAQIASLEESARQFEREAANAAKHSELRAQEQRRLLTDRAALEGRRRGIEATIEAHEGLNQGARAVLEARERGALNHDYLAVGDAIATDREYALAIETALGGSANDLIVESEAAAKAAIAHLKAHHHGRATFQPLPLIRPSAPGAEFRRLLTAEGVVGSAAELVRSDPRHRSVVESLLGRVLIVESLDEGLRLAKTSGWSRLVTLEGEVLHYGGAVTGGRAAKQSYGLVQRKSDLAELVRAISELDGRIDEMNAADALEQEKRAASQVQLEGVRLSIEELRPTYEENRNLMTSLLDELKGARRAAERLDHEIAGLDAAPVAPLEVSDCESIEAERDRVLQLLAARSTDVSQAEGRLREAQVRIGQAQERLDAATRRRETAKTQESQRGKRVASIAPEREKAALEIKSSRAALSRAVADRAEADSRLAAASEARRELLERSLRLLDEAKAARANASAVGAAVHQAELSRARAESRRATAAQRLLEEYGLSEEEALDQEGVHEIPPDAQSLVIRLRRDLKAMGDVNLGAIEAYDRLTDRFEELFSQKADVLGGIAQVQASISELDGLTREKFNTTFAAVQEAFSELFQKLFGSGDATLRLEDPGNILESGIDIEATLPGKKRQRMELLSGGERALCGCAFLFALLKVKPSPLVVLDEVDAPLDGRNVERFSDLLQEFSSRSQFIVITHNPVTIEQAPIWLGVTMQEPGVSTLIPTRAPGLSERRSESPREEDRALVLR